MDLNLAVGAGGWTADGHPRFAVARADRRRVHYEINRGRLRFDASEAGRGGPGLFRSVALAAMPQQDARWYLYRRAEALVPMIPADIREEGRAKATFIGERSWFILWEAVWTPVPPRDPILLEHLAGSLYVVLASWDLTDPERALMAGLLYGS